MNARMPRMKWIPGDVRSWRGLALRWSVPLLLLLAGLVYITAMPGHSYRGTLSPLSTSARELHDGLQGHVRHLAARIGERNVWHAERLQAAAAYIRERLEGFGYAVDMLPVRADGLTVWNVAAELRGSGPGDEVLVVGAHYDSVRGSPGANDNASGVAALLELARMMATDRPSRTVRFLAFVNEEPPFFQTEYMGSRVYALLARERNENIVGMLSLETLGYYSDRPRSQRYPFPFRFFYPDTGNFIGFVGNLSSRELVRHAVGTFRRRAAFPSEGVAAPGWVTGVGWSDHASFWEEGYAAIMVTDTALFRYEHYHASTDTPDKLDYEALTRVVEGLAHVVRELSTVK